MITVQALVGKVYDAFENHKSALLILCDLTKAFDLASHNILLLNVRKYGISGAVLATLQTVLVKVTRLLPFIMLLYKL